MGTMYLFRDKDGKKKWGEISQAYDPNKVKKFGYDNILLPVVINQGYEGEGKLRFIGEEDIIESR